MIILFEKTAGMLMYWLTNFILYQRKFFIMNDLLNKTLAQIVTGDHRSSSVFEKYQLDFCCKGKRTLEQACAEKNLDATVVINELNEHLAQKKSVAFPFDKLTLNDLITHIVDTHHDYVKKEMPVIFMYLQKVAAKHSGRHPELMRIFELFSAVKEEMEMHMVKEEKILFPRIGWMEKNFAAAIKEEADVQYLQAPIHMMEEEHDHAGTAMAEIRKLSNNYTPPADACTTYKLSFAALDAFEQDLHHHIHLENNMLFPRSIELFRKLPPVSAN